MKSEVPPFNKQFFCIANREEPVLAAQVLSYTFKSGTFTPLFEFPTVTSKRAEQKFEDMDEHHLSRVRATEFDIKIGNTLRRIGGCEYLVLVGLDENQKSYLTSLENYNVIEIARQDEADLLLNPIVERNKILNCREDDIEMGLYNAVRNDAGLRIDNNAELLVPCNSGADGLVVIECGEKVASLIGLNYALTILADVHIVPSLSIEQKGIKNLIETWREGSQTSLNDLHAMLYGRVEHVAFNNYRFATFFTIGAPYSLVLGNTIPMSHVHLRLSPDFFIFNNLYFKERPAVNSAIVFSPQQFKDEETDFVIDSLKSSRYYVRELVGERASVYQIDMHIKEFPFDILHLCSHGGEVDGYSIIAEFIDSDNIKHTVEYDEVVSFAPERGKELIPVTRKFIWRKFDGLIWGSKEFKAKGYPHYIFPQMIKKISEEKRPNRKKKPIVPDSCAIKCSDFNYQAVFNLLACTQSPIIFNNTCWSWSDISESFIATGARGYLGTLWDVDNMVAKETAEIFYSNLFGDTVLNAFYKALNASKEKKDANIYLYWGLHFTSMDIGEKSAQSRMNVTRNLLRSQSNWKEKLKSTTDEGIRKNIKEIIDWNVKQVTSEFLYEAIRMIFISNKTV